VGTGASQDPGDAGLAALLGESQRAHAVAVWEVDVDAARHQRTDSLHVRAAAVPRTIAS
jgi:hypothetical protein